MNDDDQSATFEICRDAYSKSQKHLPFLLAPPNKWIGGIRWNKLLIWWIFWFIEMKHDSELKYFKDMALFIKKAMEEKFEDSWHVIVGTNFGSFVSYEHKCICLFWLEHIGFLVFKHGWNLKLMNNHCINVESRFSKGTYNELLL